MGEVVLDTNVLLVAEGMHPDVNPECVVSCVRRLQQIMRSESVVLDDGYRVLGEYQNKLDSKRGKGAGTAFLKWLLQQQANSRRVVQVSINEHAVDRFLEFPVPLLETEFDPPQIGSSRPFLTHIRISRRFCRHQIVSGCGGGRI